MQKVKQNILILIYFLANKRKGKLHIKYVMQKQVISWKKKILIVIYFK